MTYVKLRLHLNEDENDQEPFLDIDPDTNYFAEHQQIINTQCNTILKAQYKI